MGSDLFKMILIPTGAHSIVNRDRMESLYVGSDSDSRPHLLAVIVSKKKILPDFFCTSDQFRFNVLYVNPWEITFMLKIALGVKYLK